MHVGTAVATVGGMSQTERRDTPSWVFQTWASFVIALGISTVGILYLPVTIWVLPAVFRVRTRKSTTPT